MNNISPLNVAAGRRPDEAKNARRGKAKASYATKATYKRLMEMTRASGLDPRSVCFGPDGSVSFSEAAPAHAEPLDAFTKWASKQ